MEDRTLKSRLARYLDAGFPIIYLNTFEEEKADALIRAVRSDKEVYEWNGMNGYIDCETGAPMFEDCSLEAMLEQFRTVDSIEGKLIVFKDIASYLEDATIIPKLKGMVRAINGGADANLIIVSNIVVIPKELEKFITLLEMDYLSEEEIKEVIRHFAERNGLPEVKDRLMEEFTLAFKGLTEFEINHLLALSYADDGELSRRDLRFIFDRKQQMIKKAGILEMVPLKDTMEDIGGLERLKEWLVRKSKIYRQMTAARNFGVDMPKGVLIAGVPGCGKSLSAKAAASLFEVPLLRLDMGRLMGKYVGESEANFREAIALAEAISPCVLWIDEVEKSFAGIGGGGGNGEVTTRLFGNFLTWMQEKESPTFVVATANDVTELPPELLRKGRFDEIFYVRLPEEREREKIFEIHLRKRRSKDLSHIDLRQLAEKTEGFSGADIESAVKEAVETAFSEQKKGVRTEDLLRAVRNTHAMAEVMKEDLERMSHEYERRKFKNASRGGEENERN